MDNKIKRKNQDQYLYLYVNIKEILSSNTLYI